MSEELTIAKFEFILESVELIEAWFVDIKVSTDYLDSILGKSHFNATVMRFQTIGEALKKIELAKPGLLEKYPDVDWHEIIRMREIISHHYEKLSHDIVFEACKYDLPVLKSTVKKIMADLKPSSK